ncbi:MAG: 8-oxoguanine DNA glycosylase [Candidatus Omnitrophica bacterium]|nr:8-oxoguanine DNA glycosylase [Candidatus Omnitrophota bacterium]
MEFPAVGGTVSCPDFDLAGTLASGQVFRWTQGQSPPQGRRAGPAFTGWIGPAPVRIAQEDSILSFQGTSAQAVRAFFSLDLDLPAIARSIDVDPFIHAALQSHWGLRVIRQEPWESLASFILSAFNNIPRLTGMIEELSVRFGEKPDGVGPLRGPTPFAFPRPEALARVSERALRRCGLGFRAPYLRAAARSVAGGAADLERWGGLDDDALREKLLQIPGVGEKVVECVMLFGYGRGGAFPVDVWIGRAMRSGYFRGRRRTDRRIREFARRHFGPMCGWAQQFLYCQARGARHRGAWHHQGLRTSLEAAFPSGSIS